MKAIITSLFAIFMANLVWCQNNDTEEVKRLKESIELLNLHKQAKDMEIQGLKTSFKSLKLSDGNYYTPNYYTINIDFLAPSPTISLPKDIKPGDFYQIEIENINLNLWNIDYDSNDTTLTKPMKTPTFEDIGLGNLTSLVGSFNTLSTFSTIGVQELSNPEIRQLNDNSATPSSCSDFIDDISGYPIKALGLFTPQLETVKKKYDKLLFNIKMYELNLLKQLPEKQTFYHFENALRDVIEIKKSLNETEQLVREIKKPYDSITSIKANVACIEKNKPLKELHLKHLTIYNTFFSKINEIRDQLTTEKVMTLIKNVHFLNNGVNKYTTLPIQFNGEKESVELTFNPKKDLFNLQKRKLEFSFPEPNTRNYWSLGASFYGASLKNEQYSVVGSIINDSTYTVVKEETDKVELGIASLLRFGTKIKGQKNLGFHGSFGPAVNIGENLRPRLLFGLGISKGNKHSIAVDIGGIAGYVDVKSKTVEAGTQYLIKPETLTTTRLKWGGFLAVGYLFRL